MVYKGAVAAGSILILLLTSALRAENAPAGRTFAHQVLEIESTVMTVTPEHRRRLDAILADARESIRLDAGSAEKKAEAVRVLKAIDGLLKRHNVVYPPDEPGTDTLAEGLTPVKLQGQKLKRVLKHGLNGRRAAHIRQHLGEEFLLMDCDITALMYVAVGEAIGADIRLVDLPDHMFVRFHLSGSESVNWDTNEARSVPDREYAKDYDLTDGQLEDGIYLRSLSRDEALGYIYAVRAEKHEDRGETAKAVADYEHSLELYARCPGTRNDFAWLLLTGPGLSDEQRHAALDHALAAVADEPNDGHCHDTLAAAYAQAGEFEKAVEAAKEAIELADSPGDRAEFKRRKRLYEDGKPFRPAASDKE